MVGRRVDPGEKQRQTIKTINHKTQNAKPRPRSKVRGVDHQSPVEQLLHVNCAHLDFDHIARNAPGTAVTFQPMRRLASSHYPWALISLQLLPKPWTGQEICLGNKLKKTFLFFFYFFFYFLRKKENGRNIRDGNQHADPCSPQSVLTTVLHFLLISCFPFSFFLFFLFSICCISRMSFLQMR